MEKNCFSQIDEKGRENCRLLRRIKNKDGLIADAEVYCLLQDVSIRANVILRDNERNEGFRKRREAKVQGLFLYPCKNRIYVAENY